MNNHKKLGIVFGVIYGVIIFAGAVYQALASDALLIIATAALGMGGGVIAGGLLFMMIAMCPSEDKEKAASDGAEKYRTAA